MNQTMRGKTVLITGGTSGIGQASAIGIAQKGAHVIVTGRDRTRGEQGVAQIKAQSGNDQVDLLLADLASLAEVRRLAADISQRYARLDVLVNNVGYLGNQRRTTVDGFEMHLAVNHLSPFVLTHELLPLLKASAPSRVINITGGMPMGKIDLENIQAEKSFLAMSTYSHTKKIMMAASYLFAKRLEGTGVKLMVAYPGGAQTNMTKDMTPDMVPLIIQLLWPLMKFFGPNGKPEKAAVSTILLAAAPDEVVMNGAYYNTKGRQTSWPKHLIKPGVPEAVWQRTEQLLQASASTTPKLSETPLTNAI